MNIVFDIAAALSAIVWPTMVLIVLLAYRRHVPAVFGGLASRINKLEFAGFSLELAQAKPFVPNWPAASAAPDLRHQAAAVIINDSYRSTFLTQLNDADTGDFAEINLGRGTEWLTSRLFIMAILFSRMKGLRCFVFVETTESVRKKFVGWAEPETIHWALAKRFPWLEHAFADAYSQQFVPAGQKIIVSHQGRLAFADQPNNAMAAIELLRLFLERVQTPKPVLPPGVQPPISPDAAQWVGIDDATQEHASWLAAEELETILGEDLKKQSIRSSALQGPDSGVRTKAILSVSGPFVPVVADDGRFEYLLRGDLIVEQMAKLMAAQPA
jgi:hypothetical protein